MSEQRKDRGLPPLAAMIPTGLVALGVVLWMFVDRGLLVVAGAGAFGPGILRELGLIRDLDEFQRETASRAGYHAYLAGGMTTVLVLSGIEWFGVLGDNPDTWILLILAVMWLTWLFSALLAYWGATKTATRVLVAFGSFWGIFVLAHWIGDFSAPRSTDELLQALVGVAAGLGILAPFFGLAWTTGRWPRATGIALVGVSVVFGVVVSGGGTGLAGRLLTGTVLIVPLAASGIALLRAGPDAGKAPA